MGKGKNGTETGGIDHGLRSLRNLNVKNLKLSHKPKFSDIKALTLQIDELLKLH